MNLHRQIGLLWPRVAIALCLVAAFGTPLTMAKRKHRKLLPPAVLKAKSVYLYVDFTYGAPYYVEKRVRDWGRFRIVQDSNAADLLLIMRSDGPYGAILTVMGRGYHKTYLSITQGGGTVPGRCVRLIDLFRERLEADQKAYQSRASSTQKP